MNNTSIHEPSVENDSQSNWSQPMPLTTNMAPESKYPTNALPRALHHAVTSYQAYGQQPLALVACSAIANISLACQSLANVARDKYLVSPTSLYFLVVAGSGERKSAADTVFSRAIREWEVSFKRKRAPEMMAALTNHQAWQMEKEGLLSQIKRTASNGEDVDYLKELFQELVMRESEIPILPTLYFEDATQEALASQLAKGWPSAALWSDEAGIILGNQSMKSNPMRFVALLNRLWDGKHFTTQRKTSQNFVIANRRLTLNLMMQPMLLQQLKNGGVSRQSGFLARSLVAYPESEMGKRFYQEPTDSMDFLTSYEHQLTSCLKQSEDLTISGCKKMPVLQMSELAKKHWILFFNNIEEGLKPGGRWMDVRDFASKSGENVTRLAGLFHLFEGREGDIQADHIEQAIEIINWHLYEAKRLFGSDNTAPQITDAKKLLDWLINKELPQLTLRDIQRLSPLRDKDRRNQAIDTLVEHNVARLTKKDGKSCLEINPSCY